jgi:hypothetical protein
MSDLNPALAGHVVQVYLIAAEGDRSRLRRAEITRDLRAQLVPVTPGVRWYIEHQVVDDASAYDPAFYVVVFREREPVPHAPSGLDRLYTREQLAPFERLVEDALTRIEYN